MSFQQHMGSAVPEESHSLLKLYSVEKRDFVMFAVTEADGTRTMEQFSRLEILCPNCSEVFWVDEENWVRTVYSVIKKDLVLVGRSCPYCYKTARIPQEYRKGW